MAITDRKLSDEEIAVRICRELEYEGRRFRLGEYVGILNGRILAVADTAEETDRLLTAIEPEPMRALLFQATPPEPDIIR